MVAYIKKIGVPCEKTTLEYGDFAFEGHGPKGLITIGVERKTLHDMLHCIDDARYAAHQRPGMLNLYDKSFLIIEGCWRPHDSQGILMEGFSSGMAWGECRYRSQRVMYSKLYRYLISVSLSGVTVTQSRDLYGTAFNVCEMFHYFQKKWDNHTSLIETQKLNIPTLTGKPSLVRRWAADLEGVGVKHSMDAERLFKKPITLAQADESEWLQIPGVGVRTAQSIVKEIWSGG
jgi:ERCC4-type nuclease